MGPGFYCGDQLTARRTEIGTLRKISHPNAVQFLGAATKTKPYMLGAREVDRGGRGRFLPAFAHCLHPSSAAVTENENEQHLHALPAVMEYMPGGSLADFLKRRVQLPLPRLLELALDFARGMAYLHSEAKAIIHRDLKPNNLLVGGVASLKADELVRRAGVVKISDFGALLVVLGSSLLP